jgi:hypothetical protein
MYSKFDEPFTDIVYLNARILKTPEPEIIYTIAHELAHYVVGKGKTGLYEKEAEGMVLKWGFVMESEIFDYDRPILESGGHDIGYKWASKQKDQDLKDKFGQYFEDWNNDRLSEEQIELLYYDIDTTSIIAEMGQLEDGRDINEGSEKPMIMNDGSIDRGIIWGVMGRLKEINSKIRSYYNDENASKADFLKTLEEINMKFEKLFSLGAIGGFIEEMHTYGIPEFLENYKKD